MSHDSNLSTGVATSTLFVLTFMVLKLTGHITWGWWVVFAPWWGPAALFLGVAALILSGALVWDVGAMVSSGVSERRNLNRRLKALAKDDPIAEEEPVLGGGDLTRSEIRSMRWWR